MASLDSANKSLVEAIEEKYKLDHAELDIKVFGLPKTDDSGEIVVPRLLCFHDAQITHAGDATTLAKLCKNVCEVDLDRNLIQDWKEVFEILSHVPQCTFLNLRANPLGNFEPSEQKCQQTFGSVIKLVLNLTNVSWSSINALLHVFPSLEELHLSLNKYDIVDLASDKTYPTVTSLHFRENNISDWNDIAKLGRSFPNLENLILLKNPLETFGSIEEMASTFAKLKSVNLSETRIKVWSELEKFRYLPSLCELRIQDVPLLQEYMDEERRELLLGYLPNITRLNGGKVTEGEKEDAERAFIRYYMDRSEEQQPPRYMELEAKHGKLEPLVEVDLSGSDDVAIMVHFDSQARIMQINIHQTVAQLKNKLIKEFKIETEKHRLWLHLKREGWPAPQIMREPNRTMLNHRMFDGDELYLKERYAPVRWMSASMKQSDE